jgi:Flp pilus assembly protein TadG
MIIRRVSRLLKRAARDESASPLAELALVLPMLLTLVFGTLEFASLLYQQQMITKGVQEAARFAARNPALNATVACPPASAGWTGAVTAARNVATSGVPAGGTLALQNFTPSDVAITVECNPAAGLISSNPASGFIPVVFVRAEIDARSVGFFQLLNIDDFTLTAEHREMGVGL